ncbi:OsmC family protein [Thermomonas aquatica]|jgi:putative redox protein|uniref:OsmC family protein n=1 Tax=Thermomonas aquatica TaxID=2202149 RepID=A0A5B7ZLN3_9GAMM|nr:OsmC family protein [Thermomonas aquatica]QDA56110.1 OsmC family protein [Thermomonas aquatica]
MAAVITSTPIHYAHSVTVNGHALVVDEPDKLGGKNAGPAPFDLYLASLAACTAITLRMYAERKGWELGEFRAVLRLHFGDDGRPNVHRTLHADGPLDDAQWARLLEVVANTPVTKAMRDGATITSSRGDAAKESA